MKRAEVGAAAKAEPIDESSSEKGIEVYEAPGSCRFLPAKLWAYNLVMSLKSAALFALVGMILLTVVLALGFIRDISAFTSGAIAANAMLVSLIHLLASLSMTVFLYVFHKAQS